MAVPSWRKLDNWDAAVDYRRFVQEGTAAYDLPQAEERLNKWMAASQSTARQYNEWFGKQAAGQSKEKNKQRYYDLKLQRDKLDQEALEIKKLIASNLPVLGDDRAASLIQQMDEIQTMHSSMLKSADEYNRTYDQRQENQRLGKLDIHKLEKEREEAKAAWDAAENAFRDSAPKSGAYLDRKASAELGKNMKALSSKKDAAKAKYEALDKDYQAVSSLKAQGNRDVLVDDLLAKEFKTVTAQDVAEAKMRMDAAKVKSPAGVSGAIGGDREYAQAKSEYERVKLQFETQAADGKTIPIDRWTQQDKENFVFSPESTYSQSLLEQLRDKNLSAYDKINRIEQSGYTPKQAVALIQSMDASDFEKNNLIGAFQEKERFENTQRMIADAADEHPAIYSAISVPLNALGGVAAAADDLRTVGSGAGIDHYSMGNTMQSMAGTIRQTAGDKIDNKVLRFLYDAGLSTADSALSIGAGSMTGITGLSLAMMGSGAAANTIKDGKERGLSDKQAMTSGLLAGAAEVFFEKMSLDSLRSVKRLMEQPAGSLAKKIQKVFVQMGVEGSEEAFTDMANALSDQLVNGDQSAIAANAAAYQAKGMTESEAVQKALSDFAVQLGLSFLGGAVGGGLMSGGVALGNTLTNSSRSVGRIVNMSGMAEQAAAFTMDYADEGSKAQTLALRVQAGQQLSNRQTGEMLRDGLKAYQKTVEDGLMVSLVNSGTENKQAQTIAQKVINGDTLSAKQAERVRDSDSTRRMIEGLTGVTINRGDSARQVQTTLQESAGTIFSIGRVLSRYEDKSPIKSMARDYTAETAKAFLSGYDGRIDPELYKKGFDFIHEQAMTGLDFEKTVEGAGEIGQLMSPEARYQAYYSGVNEVGGFSSQESLNNPGNRDIMGTKEVNPYGREETGNEAGGYAGIQGQRAGAGSDQGLAESTAPDGRTNSGRVARSALNEATRETLHSKGIDPIDLLPADDASFFYESIGKAKQNNSHGAFVEQHNIDDYANMKLLIGDSGHVGVAVTQDGNIVSVFKNGNSSAKGAVSSILLTAINNGGKKLDNFDGKLSYFYAQHGFIPVSRTAFVDEFAPAGWNYERDGRPDILFWVHSGETAEQVAPKIGTYDTMTTLEDIPLFDSYEKAEAYRDSKIDQLRTKDSLESELREESNQFLYGDTKADAAQSDGAKAANGTVIQNKEELRRRGVPARCLLHLDEASQAIGRRVVPYLSESTENAYERDGTIYVNMRTKESRHMIAVAHELTHTLESTGFYKDMRSFLMHSDIYADKLDKYGLTHDQLIDSYIEDYAAHKDANGNPDPVSLTRETAEREIVSDLIAENLFSNLDAICSLKGYKFSLFNRVRLFLEKVGNRLMHKGTIAKEWTQIKYLYREAMREIKKTDKSSTDRSNDVSVQKRYSLGSYTEHQKDNWADSKSILVYENDQQLSQFIDDALAKKNLDKKIYFGTIPSSLSHRVFQETGIDINGYNCTIQAQEIRKILLHSHGNEQFENARGQRVITKLDIMSIPQVIESPDRVVLSPRTYEGKPVIQFIKTIDGKTTVVSYVSKKHHDLAVQTMYTSIKKGNLAPATDAPQSGPLSLTSETAVGTVSNNTVSQTDTGVNTSIRSDVEDMRGGSSRHSQGSMEERMRRLADKYGTIPEGEKATVKVEIPAKTSDAKNTRRYVRTVMESGILTDEMVTNMDKAILDEALSYTPIGDDSAITSAEKRLNTLGYERMRGAFDQAVNDKRVPSKEDIVLGESLLRAAAERGDNKAVVELTTTLAEAGTRAGQAVQALRLLKKMNGVPKLLYIRKAVDKMNREIDRRNAGVRPDKQQNHFVIDEALAQELVAAKTETESEIVEDMIKQDLANQKQASLVDKWNAWRYLAMLGNPRTHVRNFVGNAVFYPATRIKDAIAVPLEAIAVKKGWTDYRTKALHADKEYRDFANRYFEDVVAKEENLGTKWNDKNAFQDRQHIFKTKGLEKSRRLNSKALDIVDVFFMRRHFIHAFAGYLQANKMDLEEVSKTGEVGSVEKIYDLSNPQLMKARAYALNEAKKATYRDESALAKTLKQFSDDHRVAGILLEGMLPFKKTPINILKRGIEYSPAGLVDALTRGVYQFRKTQIAMQNGQVMEHMTSANDLIDRLASGMTGTAVLCLGMFLQSMGLISGGEDDEEGKFEQMNGRQPYAFNLNILGQNVNFTIDWAAPISLPLFVGVELMAAIQGDYADASFSDVSTAIFNIAEPMINMSMLDGLNSMFEGISNAETGGEKIFTAMTEATTSYFTQGIPTILGQVARTIDNKRRSIYIDKNSWVPTNLQYLIGKTRNKIPGVSMLSEPYVDAFGREDVDDNVLSRAFQNFISPGYIDQYKQGAVEKELSRLYREMGDEDVLPKKLNKYVTVDGERVHLSAEEYTTLSKVSGETAYTLLQEVITNPSYASLADAEKLEVVKNIYSIAKAAGATKVSDYQPDGWVRRLLTKDWEHSSLSLGEYLVHHAIAKTDMEYDEDKGVKVSYLYTSADIGKAIELNDTDKLVDMLDDFSAVGKENGKTEKEVASAIRSRITEYYKPLYQQAYPNQAEMRAIRSKLMSNQLRGHGIRYTMNDFSGWIKETVKK